MRAVSRVQLAQRLMLQGNQMELASGAQGSLALDRSGAIRSGNSNALGPHYRRHHSGDPLGAFRVNSLLLAWLAEVGIITWRDLTGKVKGHTIEGLPLPADYLATFLVFGVLGFVPKSNPGAARAASLAGWAFVLATYLNVAPSILNPTSTKATTTAQSTATTATGSATIQQ